MSAPHNGHERPSLERRSIVAGIAAAPFAASFAARALAAGQPAPTPAAASGPFPAQGMAAYSAKGRLKMMQFQRRALGPKDVAIKLQYCGVCHSDIHTVRGDWGKMPYPLIVGHELAGEVVAVGASARKFGIGSRVGVGTMVNSCRTCSECQAGHENYCLNGNTQAYASKDRDGSITQGGYSTFVVVDEDFVIDIPKAIDLAVAGPLLCAGITVFSPLRHWRIDSGKKVAIVGMGGLGHLAVKFAKSMGADVTVFTTSPEKTADAKRFGATNVVVNRDGADFSAFKHEFDFALDTVPYRHDLNRFIPLLKRDATYCRVGVGKVADTVDVGQMNLVLYRNAIAGSNTGGIRETQQMVDYCATNGIQPEIQKIPMSGIDEAWTRVVEKKARYRYVVETTA